jgi:hypothetical protein
MCVEDNCSNNAFNAITIDTSYIKSTPTSNISSNYFAVLEDTWIDEDDDDKTIVTSNKSQYEHCDNATVSTRYLTDDDTSVEEEFRDIEIESGTVPKAHLEQYALFDSGATAHFLVQGAPVINKQPVVKPLKIKLPDGNFIESTHTCNLNIPWLPTSVTEAHIVPGLQHSSLISTRKFCDAGCKVIFETEECKVFYKNKLVLTGV